MRDGIANDERIAKSDSGGLINLSECTSMDIAGKRAERGREEVSEANVGSDTDGGGRVEISRDC